ncbi:MAG: PrsW family glutamic-type intramembrane protease [Tepidisphaeraceae bacterium]
MAITFSCECGKRLRTPDDWGGRWVRCTACKRELLVPLPEGSSFALADDEPAPPPPPIASPPVWQPVAHEPTTTRIRPVLAAPAGELGAAERSWRGYLFWLLLLAMIPLGVHTFQHHDSFDDRLERMVEASPELQQKLGEYDPETIEPEDVFDILPGNRLDGALLGRYAWIHWIYALLSAGLFFAFVTFALPGLPARPLHLLLAGLFTGTLGVMLLLAIQVFGLFCFCCVGAWYMAALDPSAPFGPSLLGFFLGVGLFEELIKSLPVLWRLYRPQPCGWREACLWGMASGAGFGVSESIHYASNYYNGIEPMTIYFVRFLSCVAFHAMLSGSCGILLQRHQHHLDAEHDYFDWAITFIAIISVPMFLHGLFNTLAKKEMDVAQLALSAVSFAWLAYLIGSSRNRERSLDKLVAAAPVFERTAQGTRIVPR